MKKISTLLLFSFFFLTAFAPVKGLDDVIGALQQGNTSVLAKYIDETVEVNLPQSHDCYSKTQAVMVLKYFFNSNKGVTGFYVKSKGNNSGTLYCTGVLHTRSGNYRTTIFMKHKSNRQLMKEINFQPI